MKEDLNMRVSEGWGDWEGIGNEVLILGRTGGNFGVGGIGGKRSKSV